MCRTSFVAVFQAAPRPRLSVDDGGGKCEFGELLGAVSADLDFPGHAAGANLVPFLFPSFFDGCL